LPGRPRERKRERELSSNFTWKRSFYALKGSFKRNRWIMHHIRSNVYVRATTKGQRNAVIGTFLSRYRRALAPPYECDSIATFDATFTQSKVYPNPARSRRMIAKSVRRRLRGTRFHSPLDSEVEEPRYHGPDHPRQLEARASSHIDTRARMEAVRNRIAAIRGTRDRCFHSRSFQAHAPSPRRFIIVR